MEAVLWTGWPECFCASAGHPDERFNALQQTRAEIKVEIEEAVSWLEGGELSWAEKGACHILIEYKGSIRLTDPKGGWEATRKWVADSLFELWEIVEPHLDKLRQEEEAVYSK